MHSSRNHNLLPCTVRRLHRKRIANFHIQHRQDFTLNKDRLIRRRIRARFKADRANMHRFKIWDDEQQHRHPLIWTDFGSCSDPRSCFGFRNAWSFADSFYERLIHSIQLDERGGGIRTQIIGAHLAAQNGVGAQDHANAKNADRNRNDHHRHATARGLQIAQYFFPTRAVHLSRPFTITPSANMMERVKY